jgi:hypothetical protein
MGLLDEAIRDHLELKRRHGADPGEIARIEHEALGPARREPAAATAPVEEPPSAPYDDEEYGYGDEVPAEERLDAPVHHLEPRRVAEPEPQPEPEEPVAAEEPAVAEPDEDVPAEDAPPASSAEQETQQFSLEELDAAAPEPAHEDDVVPADDEPESHDELEETPEFLQETPEHDRLWFEQKPPRDFDF